MKSLATQTTVICATVSLFLGSTFVVVKGVDTISSDKIKAVMASSANAVGVTKPITSENEESHGPQGQ